DTASSILQMVALMAMEVPAAEYRAVSLPWRLFNSTICTAPCDFLENLQVSAIPTLYESDRRTEKPAGFLMYSAVFNRDCHGR
ncbi:hypothetical protein Q4595_16890, partial [Wenyingzhuangia sp. 1_MG-2023]|nr:hypothetical protein [Wenyingzhuangia sp. 1_MG-2023]